MSVAESTPAGSRGSQSDAIPQHGCRALGAEALRIRTPRTGDPGHGAPHVMGVRSGAPRPRAPGLWAGADPSFRASRVGSDPRSGPYQIGCSGRGIHAARRKLQAIRVGPDELPTNAFDADWQRLLEDTRTAVASGRSNWFEAGLLPILEAAAVEEKLRKYYPFTSMSRLCMAETRYPFQGLQPAYIEWLPKGPLRVYGGSPYPGDGPVVLETDDPSEAVAELCRRVG